jgi:hypothetical protein
LVLAVQVQAATMFRVVGVTIQGLVQLLVWLVVVVAVKVLQSILDKVVLLAVVQQAPVL